MFSTSSGVTAGGAGGRVPPNTSHWEISAVLPGKERQREVENGEEKKENRKKESGKLKMEGGKLTTY